MWDVFAWIGVGTVGLIVVVCVIAFFGWLWSSGNHGGGGR